MHIILPKSITGLMPLVYSVAKAKIVVKAAKDKVYTFLRVRIIRSVLFISLFSKNNCRYLTTM